MSELGLNRKMVRAIWPKVDWDEYDREVMAEAAAPASPDVVREALRGHLPTLFLDAPHDERVHCDCGIRDHLMGWWAHIIIEVLEPALAALPAAAPAPLDERRQAAYVVSGLPVALRLDFIREVAQQIGYAVVAATPQAQADPPAEGLREAPHRVLAEVMEAERPRHEWIPMHGDQWTNFGSRVELALAARGYLLAATPATKPEAGLDFIAAVQALTEEIYVPHHTPSSESGPEDWDVELLAPEQETVERVIRHLAAYAESEESKP